MAWRKSTIVGVLTAAVATFSPQTPIASAQEGCGQWSLDDPPVDARSVINVEARSADDAWAVAYFNPRPKDVIRWDGTVWSRSPTAGVCSEYDPISVEALALFGPSHVLVSARAATGAFSTVQLLLISDGTGWDNCHSLTLQPDIQGAPRNGAPNAIVAAATDDAWILGAADGIGDGSGEGYLTVHWNGSELTEESTSGGPGNAWKTFLDGVAFASDDIWAVGQYRIIGGGSSGYHASTYHFDGTSWNYVSNPAETLGGQSTNLNTVAGVAPDDVWAAGSYGSEPLFMHWDGSSWTIVPGPATTGTVHEMIAIASDDVWAVDFWPSIGKFYHWDGVSWSIVPPQEIPGAIEVRRDGGLAAVGECDLWATGSIDYGSGVEPFIERLRPGSVSTGEPGIGQLHSLLEVAPNPLRRTTSIRLTTPGDEIHAAHVYDVGGSLIRTLANGTAASGDVSWDGRDDAGAPVRGGVYFVRVESMEGVVQTRKLTVVH